MQEDINSVQPYFDMLPDNNMVFAPESAFLAKHLLPLLSIELSAVNSKWQGKIHLVNPIEPYECYIGSATTEYADEFANENWFIMQLNAQHQYEWLANKNYFQREHHDVEPELKQHGQNMHADYLKLKQRYLDTGKIISTSDLEYENDTPTTLLNQLGGETGAGNWTSPIEEHFELRYINQDTDDEEVHVYDREGQRYYFVAAVAGWEYCCHGADWILMFYQPETQRVLYTFDWS